MNTNYIKGKKNLQSSIFFLLFLVTQLIFAQSGCTDPLANNYDSSASTNDGSCTYDQANVIPSTSDLLDPVVAESSGVILWDNKLWTHNDNENSAVIYALDVNDFSNISSIDLPSISNVDWEEIAQDSNHIYIGDFGNNSTGNRTDLTIYKISKASITNGNPVIENINFSYEDQTDFSEQSGNTTNFDCEAMIVRGSSIYLFTKEWTNQETSVYTLPNAAGTYSASNLGSYDIEGLITGATHVDGEQLIVLTGYGLEIVSLIPLSIAPNSFLVLLYDFQGNDFFSGNKRKVDFNGQDMLQVEGIAASENSNFYLTNERYNQSNVDTPAQIHDVDLSLFLSDFLSTNDFYSKLEKISAFPNPLDENGRINLNIPKRYQGKKATFEIYDVFGRQIFQEIIESLLRTETLDLSKQPSGTYLMKINIGVENQNLKLIKI